MRKRKTSKTTTKIPNTTKSQIAVDKVESKQLKTQFSDNEKSMWKVEDTKLNVDQKQTVEEDKIQFREALAKSIIDQTDLGIKKISSQSSLKICIMLQHIIPRDRHLLVPINVQALVVPRTEMPDAGVKTKSNRVPNIKNIRESNISQSAITTYPQRANLKSDFREKKLRYRKRGILGHSRSIRIYVIESTNLRLG